MLFSELSVCRFMQKVLRKLQVLYSGLSVCRFLQKVLKKLQVLFSDLSVCRFLLAEGLEKITSVI